MNMRKTLLFVAALMLIAACQSVLEEQVQEEPQVVDETVVDNGEIKIQAPDITAVQEGDNPTKSVLEVDGEGVGTIYWIPADEINVFYGTTSTHYVSQNAVNATTAVFSTTDVIGSTESASENIWGLYPYNSSATCTGSAVTTTLPATQYGVPGTFDDDLFITLAHNTSTALTFYNVCGGIKFSLTRDDISTITFSGNNDEDIAGDFSLTFEDGLPNVSVTSGEKTITLTPKAGGVFASGEYYYLILRPVTLSSGFTITFDTATEIGTFNYTAKSVTVKRSVFGKKDGIDDYASFVSKSTATNLSESGTANCYIVSSAGDYKFNATVKGNSNESVGTPATAEVLWESYGTSVAPSVGDLVNTVSLQDGYVYFSATDAKGNALIAVKDSEDAILWSWHIWLTEQPVEQVYNNSAGTLMDRNLGATEAIPGDVRSIGLLYECGRKDPFLNTQSASTGAWPDGIRSDKNTGTVGYSVANPMKQIWYNYDTYDWIYSSVGTSHGYWYPNSDLGAKYNPCPSGWYVPLGGDTGVWATALGKTSVVYSSSDYDSVNKGYNLGQNATDKLGNSQTIWYPFTGNTDGSCWASNLKSPSEHNAIFSFSQYSLAPSSVTTYQSSLRSVRCQKR